MKDKFSRDVFAKQLRDTVASVGSPASLACVRALQSKSLLWTFLLLPLVGAVAVLAVMWRQYQKAMLQ